MKTEEEENSRERLSALWYSFIQPLTHYFIGDFEVSKPSIKNLSELTEFIGKIEDLPLNEDLIFQYHSLQDEALPHLEIYGEYGF